ncbi:MAG: hypothetical protein V9E98_16030 [Candidatus Nanopelagicales bacterium]
MERHSTVGCVQRESTPPRLSVDHSTSADEMGDVRDGVSNPPAGPTALDVDSLIQVDRAFRVDSDQRDIGRVTGLLPRLNVPV